MSPTAIEWTDDTWNPVRGCSRVSEGCRHCYAEQQAARIVRMGKGKPTAYDGLVKLVGGEARWTGVVRLVPEHLADPLKWRKPRRIFVNSMSDIFHESLTNEQIAAVFGVMAACPHHTFQVLTKRAGRMREWFEWAEKHGDGHDLMRFGPSALLTCAWEACSGDAWGDIEPPGKLESLPSADVFGSTWPLPNVWLGVSVENQDAFDERWPDLAATPAAVRFLSCEPLLGGVNAIPATESGLLGWVIAGCESGSEARMCDKRWLQWLRDQCSDHRIPYFLKQAVDVGDEKFDADSDGRPRGITCGPGSHRKPGSIIGAPYLDGVQHMEFPK